MAVGWSACLTNRQPKAQAQNGICVFLVFGVSYADQDSHQGKSFASLHNGTGR
jgi:hypothetical protein